jgi:hypothetical protein
MCGPRAGTAQKLSYFVPEWLVFWPSLVDVTDTSELACAAPFQINYAERSHVQSLALTALGLALIVALAKKYCLSEQSRLWSLIFPGESYFYFGSRRVIFPYYGSVILVFQFNHIDLSDSGPGGGAWQRRALLFILAVHAGQLGVHDQRAGYQYMSYIY